MKSPCRFVQSRLGTPARPAQHSHSGGSFVKSDIVYSRRLEGPRKQLDF